MCRWQKDPCSRRLSVRRIRSGLAPFTQLTRGGWDPITCKKFRHLSNGYFSRNLAECPKKLFCSLFRTVRYRRPFLATAFTATVLSKYFTSGCQTDPAKKYSICFQLLSDLASFLLVSIQILFERDFTQCGSENT